MSVFARHAALAFPKEDDDGDNVLVFGGETVGEGGEGKVGPPPQTNALAILRVIPDVPALQKGKGNRTATNDLLIYDPEFSVWYEGQVSIQSIALTPYSAQLLNMENPRHLCIQSICRHGSH